MNENFTSTDNLERVAKLAVDVIYSRLQAKSGHLYSLYKSYDNKYEGRNKYFSTMHKRYKYLTNYVSFVRRNKGYWYEVYNLLLKEMQHEGDALLMDTESNKAGG